MVWGWGGEEEKKRLKVESKWLALFRRCLSLLSLAPPSPSTPFPLSLSQPLSNTNLVSPIPAATNMPAAPSLNANLPKPKSRMTAMKRKPGNFFSPPFSSSSSSSSLPPPRLPPPPLLPPPLPPPPSREAEAMPLLLSAGTREAAAKDLESGRRGERERGDGDGGAIARRSNRGSDEAEANALAGCCS